MKVLFAMDSMKGSLSSIECGNAAAQGLLKAIPDAEYVVRPMADGGEGTVTAITTGCNGRYIKTDVTGPLETPIHVCYGIAETYGKSETKTAIIEMSSAAGLPLVPITQRDPMNTTTYGLGQMIKHAISEGCMNFVIGLGGSSTNDCGIGMLQALGYTFFDKTGKEIKGLNGHLLGKDLEFIDSIKSDHVDPVINNCTFHIACDVKNPLYGPNGASHTFAAQKGAFQTDIELMEGWIQHFAEVASRFTGKTFDPEAQGYGAAGGLGFCFNFFLNGKLEAGISIVTEATNLRKYISEADIIVTGEGCMDSQTNMGKTPSGVAHIAKVFNKPVIAITGIVSDAASGIVFDDIDAYFPTIRNFRSKEETLSPVIAKMNITATSEQIFRLLALKDQLNI